MVAIGNAEKVSQATVEDVRKYFREVIIPDPITIHARGKREELNSLILESVLKQITRNKVPR